MQLPNKLYSYRISTLALLPVVLRKLQNSPVPVVDLYKRMQWCDKIIFKDGLNVILCKENGENFIGK